MQNNMRGWLLSLLFLVLCAAIYFPGRNCPFLFDDAVDIENNYSMRTIWPPWVAMFTGNVLPTRPLPYYSFALNYAFSGSEPFSYHVVDLCIHVSMGLLIYGILSRIMPQLLPQSTPKSSSMWAGLIALVWLVHPLQTSCVLYIYQRIEQLWSLCFLLALYALQQSVQQVAYAARWKCVSVLSLMCGMFCKETMVVAPILLLLFDRSYLTTSWMRLWKSRSGYYLLAFSSYGGLLFLFLFQADLYAENSPLQVSHWQYLLTEAYALSLYLKLIFVPYPLCFEYPTQLVNDWQAVAGPILLILSLLVLTIGAMFWRPRLGFWGAWFFLILGPTSSLLPTMNPICEYRMLLPSLAVIVLCMVFFAHLATHWKMPERLTSIMLICLLLGLSCMTWNRCLAYTDFLTLWKDNARKQPTYYGSDFQIGMMYFKQGDDQQADHYFEQAENKSHSQSVVMHYKGLAAMNLGRMEESVIDFKLALERPFPVKEIWLDLAHAYEDLKQPQLAIPSYRQYLTLTGNDPGPAISLATLLASLPYPEKTAHLREIIQLVDGAIANMPAERMVYEKAAEIFDIYGDTNLAGRYRSIGQRLKE
jgi:tetratricopeptide (TPR) repeat protein